MPPEETQYEQANKPSADEPSTEKKQTIEATPVERQLSSVGRFIDKYYLQQSKGVQTGTFIVFVLLFVYGFLNVVNGKYVLKGNLLAENGKRCGDVACKSLAPYYGLKWGTEDFATNSKGEYNVPLGYSDYLRAMISGSHEIKFLQLEQVVWSGNVPIKRLDSEFGDITIPYVAVPPPSPPPTPDASNRMQLGSDAILFPSAWASEAPSAGMYQLIVQGIWFASIASKANATIELVLDSQTLEMRDRSIGNLAAGHIPLIPGQHIDLGSNLYFLLPSNSLPVRGQIRLTAPASGFFQLSNYSEDFALPDHQAIGQALQLKGSRGSTLTVSVVFTQAVKLYREADWAAKKDAMEADFLKQGFIVRWADPPLGALAETNSLWTGLEVPFDVVQRLLRVAVTQQIPLKKIQYRYEFQSSKNPTEIQLGSSKACANASPIPSEALEQAIAAPGEGEFQRIIAPFTCAVATATQSQARRRSR